MKEQTIEITKETLKAELFADALFFMFSDENAISEAGTFWSVHKNGKIYFFDYIGNKMTKQDAISYLSARINDNKDWHINTHRGNLMIVHDDIYKAFRKHRNNYSCMELIAIVVDIVNTKNNVIPKSTSPKKISHKTFVYGEDLGKISIGDYSTPDKQLDELMSYKAKQKRLRKKAEQEASGDK